jgi:hypothetical protein
MSAQRLQRDIKAQDYDADVPALPPTELHRP